MWSWHWSPLTQTSLLLSPSDGLASFLQTTLAIGVKVVKKVITSKFRFHLIAIYALGCFRIFSCTPVPKLPWRAPNPRETSERMNFNVIDKKQLIWKLLIYCIDIWCLFFIKKYVTKCLGDHYAIWTSDSNFLLAPKNNFGPAKADPHFRHWSIILFIFFVYFILQNSSINWEA